MKKRVLLAAVLAALGNTAIHADDPVNLGEVVVTDTRSPVPLRLLPDNTVRLDGTSLALIQETHPAQLFSMVPGAWVTAGGGQESLMGLRSPLFTGQGACGAFLLLEDGIPIQPAGFCNVNALFELNTEQAEAVEVIRGPGSVLYGGNALHGIVNVLTEPADHAPMDEAAFQAGSHDYLRLETSVGTWDGADGFRVAANAAHDGGFRADSGFDQQKLDLRLDHVDGAFSRETLFAATNLDQDTAGYIYGISAYKDETLRDSNPTPGAYRRAQSFLLAQRWQLDLADEDELDFTPYVRRNTQAFVQHYIPGEPVEHDADNSLGWELAMRTHPGIGTAIIYGLDGEYAHGSIIEFQPLPFSDTRPDGYHYDYTADSRTLAGYVHLTQLFGPDWILSGGLRAEGVRYSYVNYLPVGDTRDDGTPCPAPGCLFSRPADRSDRFVNIMPKLGLSWLVTHGQTIYANLGRGARAPQVAELYSLQQQQTEADLDSETLDNHELGWRGAAGALRWDADAYYMLKDHVIFRDANGFNVSDGRTRHRGVEFAIGYAFSERLALYLDGSYAVHSYAFSAQLAQGNSVSYGDDVKYAPRTLGGARLRWQPLPATQLEFQYLHVGGYWLDEANQHRYGGHDLVNFSARQGVGPGYTLTLRVLNAADTPYAERADYSFGNYRYFPGDGRVFFVGLEMGWQ